MITSDVPIFAGTEDAMRYGRELRRVVGPDEFQTLVRAWIVSQRAVANAINDQAKVILATRCQLLREAVETFLFDGPAAPATKRDPDPLLPAAAAEAREHELVLEGCS